MNHPLQANLVLRRSVAGMAFFLLVAGLGRCLGPRPPRTPVLGGSEAGQPGDTLIFWARSTDPNGGELSYLFDWDDGSSSNWTAEHASGDTCFRRHGYSETGNYGVRVRARDRDGLESGWSESRALTVAFAGPLVPARPEGPAVVYEDTVSWFQASAGHVRAESVSIQFDWDDTLGLWSGFVAAGRPVSDSHSYTSVGVFLVRARARDRSGFVSRWSEPQTVAVSRWPLAPVKNLTLRASAGTNVKLRWETGRNGDSVRYQLWFEPLGGVFGPVDSTRGTSIFHDPFGLTGRYAVSARLGEEEMFAAETLSTVPAYTDTTRLEELNVGGRAGYGWDSATGRADRYSMEDTSKAGMVDWYFTDLAPGRNGPFFFFASPHLGPTDPGERVPPGRWRKTGLLLLFGNVHQPVPEYDSLLYADLVDATILESYAVAYTQDGYYALVKNLGPDPGAGTIRVLSWFQKVKGLRLMQHAEPE